jgi:hypothetical protein
MLYMIVETFRTATPCRSTGDSDDRGRLAPDGLRYVFELVTSDLATATR